MGLNEREESVKRFMEELFVPALHQVVEEANPEQYKKWGGNACRQTAFFGRKILADLLPDYTWTVWDGIFDDIVNDKPVQYNHAWIYGVDKASGKRLLVDLARLHHERLFIEVTGNRYPKDHPSYFHMKEVKREKVDLEDWGRAPEYYTQLDASSFMDRVLSALGRK